MKRLNILISFILLFTSFPYTNAQVVINEISICNVNQEIDPNYDYSGWIELYNTSDAEINIRNLYFSDDIEQPVKYRLGTNRTLPAKGFAIVWLNEELKENTTGYFMDTDADDGGIITISNKSGVVYDKLEYGMQYTNVSYGRKIDGDKTQPLVYFIESSISKSNNASQTATEVIATPSFTAKSGFYENEVKAKIAVSTVGAKIFYTTDASEPDTGSIAYTAGEEITITKTTTLRAKAFKEGTLKGLIATATYMINERKPSKLPVVFLTTSPENLNDDSLGIYVEGVNGIVLTSDSKKANYNRDWNRWAHIELLDTLNNAVLNQSIGIGISGNASRKYPQKSFKIFGKTKYGKQRFDVPLFPTHDGMRFKSFLIRNGGQYYNAVQLIHDACLQSLADVTTLDYQASFPAVAYLNGAYWGIYNFRERKNKDMIYSHYGLSETSFDIVDYNWRAKANNGNLNAWSTFEEKVKASDFTKDQDYDTIASKMDIDNYLYYMSIEMLLKNGDWPNNNQIIFRSHQEGSKWKWILQDLDKCLVNGSPNNMLKNLYESTSTLLSTKLITYLLNNEKFKQDYITVQSLVAGSVYAPDRFKKRQLEMRDAISAEYPYYQVKWEEQGQNHLDKTTNNIISYAAAACSQMYDHLKVNFSLENPQNLKITSTIPETPIMFNNRQIPILPYDGKWFENKPLSLKAQLYEKGKKFAYWEIKTSNKTTTSPETSIEILIEKETEVTAVYQPEEMVRRFGLFINEISANNSTNVDNEFKYEDWIEIYNGSNKDIDIAGLYISNSKSKPELHKISDKDRKLTTIKAGSYGIIWCSKKPERGVLHTSFKLAKEGGSVYLHQTNEANQTVLVDSVFYAPHEEKNSFGRYPDGDETLVTFELPTFKAANQQSAYNILSYIESFPLVNDIKQTSQKTDRPIIIKTKENQLYIKCPKAASYKIISINGKTVAQARLEQEESYIQLNNHSKGIYLIQIESDTQRWAFKIVI